MANEVVASGKSVCFCPPTILRAGGSCREDFVIFRSVFAEIVQLRRKTKHFDLGQSTVRGARWQTGSRQQQLGARPLIAIEAESELGRRRRRAKWRQIPFAATLNSPSRARPISFPSRRSHGPLALLSLLTGARARSSTF